MQLVWPQEVVVGNPQRKVIVGAIVVVEPVRGSIGGLISAVEAFDHLLERTKFRGYGIIVRKADDLGDLKLEFLAKLMEELLCGKRIGAVAVSDETEVFREFFQMLEGHAHSHNARTDTAIIRYLIADHRPGRRIDDQPDVTFDAADFDVCLISSKGGSLLIRIGIDKGFDADGSGLAVIGDHLVGYGNAVDVLHGLCGFSERQTEIDVVGKTQRHDISVVFAEFQRGGVLRQGGDVHLEEVYRELTVDVMELIFVFAIVFIQIGPINFLQVVKVVGAFGIHALVDDEVLTILLTRQSMGAVRTFEGEGLGETVLIR